MSRVHTTQYTNYANYTVPRKLMTCTASLLKDYRPIIALDISITVLDISTQEIRRHHAKDLAPN